MSVFQWNLHLPFWISFTALMLIYRPGCASMYSWKEGLIHCDTSDDTRQPTLEDVSILRNDSWIYVARIFLPQISEDCTNCSDSCPCIVFNRNRSSLISQRSKMEPGIHYILHDYGFEDFPDPDECLKYHVNKKAAMFGDCKEKQNIQCLNYTQTDFEATVTACYQPDKNDLPCFSLPKIHERKSDQDDSIPHCTIPWICQTRHTCGILLIIGSIVVFGILNVVCIYCSVRYFVRRKLASATLRQGDRVPSPVRTTVHIYSHI
nr:uncharacterized protein LOC105328110 isoform X6 [Crassostrea gigas]